MRGFWVIAVGLIVVNADALAQQRPALRGVSSVRIANYGSPSLLLQQRGEIQDLVDEVNGLRRRDWRRGDTSLNCYSTLVFMSAQKRIAEFRVRPDVVVERPVDKGQSPYTLLINPADIPKLSQLLSAAKPATCQ